MKLRCVLLGHRWQITEKKEPAYLGLCMRTAGGIEPVPGHGDFNLTREYAKCDRCRARKVNVKL